MVKKKFTISTKKVHCPVEKGSLTGECHKKITKTQEKIKIFLTEEFLTPKQVATRINTSNSNIYKHIRKVKERGHLDKNYTEQKKVHKNECTDTSKTPSFPLENIPYISEEKSLNEIRLHGQEFNVRILYQDHKYEKIKKKTNLIDIDGNTIKLNEKSIEIYCGHSFYANDSNKATYKSMNYLSRLFRKIEHDLKIVISKPRAQNVKIVNHHYAEINNEIAKEFNVNKEKLHIYCKNDGKLWLTIDNSFNLNEIETQHPETAQPDMNAIKPHLEAMRDPHTPNLKELSKVINELAKQNTETAIGLNSLIKLMSINPMQTNNSDKQNKENLKYIG